MLLPIVAFGHPVLKKKANEIESDYPNLDKLIENMFETMYNANGVGLAAPQINLPIRLFIVDGTPMFAEEEPDTEFKKVFINAEILEEEGEEWQFEEGCLSIPDIREMVSRQDTITIRYFDQDFKEHTEVFDGIRARIIQHEYDHIEGVLFTDYLSGFRKQLLKTRLGKISKGAINAGYPMRFPNKR